MVSGFDNYELEICYFLVELVCGDMDFVFSNDVVFYFPSSPIKGKLVITCFMLN